VCYCRYTAALDRMSKVVVEVRFYHNFSIIVQCHLNLLQ
jgi:hypothetical protein